MQMSHFSSAALKARDQLLSNGVHSGRKDELCIKTPLLDCTAEIDTLCKY